MARLKRKALKTHKERHKSWQKYAKAEIKRGDKPKNARAMAAVFLLNTFEEIK